MHADNLKISHSTFIRVRYADTDKMGIVYNGNYLTYFEVGRTELMRAFELPYTYFEKNGYLLPLIESYVNYKQSAFYDDILEVIAMTDLSSIGATFRFDYIVKNNDQLIASGFTNHTFVKNSTMKPVKPPQILIDLVEKLKNK